MKIICHALKSVCFTVQNTNLPRAYFEIILWCFQLQEMFGDLDEEPVVIKVRRQYENLGYPPNTNEIDYGEPFTRDRNGFMPETQEHKIQIKKGTIDYGPEASYGEAVKAIEGTIEKDETQNVESGIFTCPFCSIMFIHPKRFLIHYKWHNHGTIFDAANNEPPKRRNVKMEKIKLEKIKLEKVKLEKEEIKKQEEEQGEFECDICSQIYTTRKSLKTHRIRVHTSLPKECTICHKTFGNSGYLRSHMMSHNRPNKFMCTQCPKTFKFHHSLQRHMPTHLEEKNFPCTSCDKSFGSDLLLKIHYKTHEKPTKGKTFTCSYCPKTFYQSFSQVAHERTHTGEKPFECDVCKQRYPTNSSLKRHLKVTHGGQLPFPCELCDRSFHVRSAWDYHVRRCHFKERPHACDMCSSAFNCQSELAKHKRKQHEKDDAAMLVGHQMDGAEPSTHQAEAGEHSEGKPRKRKSRPKRLKETDTSDDNA